MEQGSAEYRRLDQSPGSTLLYAGENLRLDAAGAILGVTLGTWQGRLQLPGDPLPAQSWHEAQTRIPRLGGGLPRFGGATTLLDILRDALAELLGTQLGQQGYDSGSGVITYSLNGQHYRLIPLGEVSLLVNQLTSSSLGGTAGGVFELASRGIQISLAGSVGYFTDLQATLKNIDANATMTLNPGGVLEIHLNGGRYAALPGIAVTLPATPTPIPGFEIGPTGLAAFRDHLGAIQTLYPAFIDTATLVSVASGLDPAATLGSLGTGWVDLATQGVTLRLQPDYAVIPLPAGRENDAWWQENGHFYLRNADQSAQGFGVQ